MSHPNLPPASVPMVPRLSAQSLQAALAAPTPLAYARWPVLFGLVVVLGMVLGSIVWAALVPLASAAIAPGQVVVSSTRKVVQHLEGGIVKTITVAEGDHVAAGDPLVMIDDTQARAQYDVVRSQYLALKAREARLIAERDGKDAVSFDHPVFRETDIAGYDKALEGQRTAFAARHKALTSQVDINAQRVAQLKEQIAGLQAQVASADRQLVLIEEEHKDVKGLYDRGNERKPRLLALERSMAEIIGTRGSYQAQIAQARQAITETELKSLDITTQFNAEVVKELGDAQNQIADLEERFRTLADRVERSVVRAPMAGTVVNLRVHTEGGVIPPGGELLDLVPSGDELVIDAQVKPEDIDVVHTGQPVMLRVVAFDQRTVPPLEGTLSLVSADRLEDKRTGAPYYRARITLDPTSLARLDGLQLQPGMPVEAMIKTGEHPLLRTLVSPILHSLNRAFRES